MEKIIEQLKTIQMIENMFEAVNQKELTYQKGINCQLREALCKWKGNNTK